MSPTGMRRQLFSSQHDVSEVLILHVRQAGPETICAMCGPPVMLEKAGTPTGSKSMDGCRLELQEDPCSSLAHVSS